MTAGAEPSGPTTPPDANNVRYRNRSTRLLDETVTDAPAPPNGQPIEPAWV